MQTELKHSIDYLSSPEALASIQRDPYWPKWDTPWWHMVLLHELGETDKIPQVAIDKMTSTVQNHYLKTFPLTVEEIPPGVDPRRQIPCHCALGGIYQVLFARDPQLDQKLPWIRPWFLKYQMPDGGLNCDESAYTKTPSKSSIVSTLPCLEAIFFCRNGELKEKEIDFISKGVQYLLRQKLYRKISNGEVIDSNWLEIRFPRFYEYDFFRGYYFLARWSQYSGFKIPTEIKEEVHALVLKQIHNGQVILNRYHLVDRRSYNPTADQSWAMGDASEFPLMKKVSQAGIPNAALTKQWNLIKSV